MFNFESSQAKILPQFDPNLIVLLEYKSTETISKFLKLTSSKIVNPDFWGDAMHKIKLGNESVYYTLFGCTDKISEMDAIPMRDCFGNALNFEDSSKLYHALIADSRNIQYLNKTLRRVI